MPELPDIQIYLESLETRVLGRRLERARVASPFLLRSVAPAPEEARGRRIVALRRLGKRIVLAFEQDLFFVLHLMVAGRLRWKPAGAKLPARIGLAAFDFSSGTLLVTEAGSRKRASLHVVRGEGRLAEHDPGGLEVLETDLRGFAAVVLGARHTLKRTLTDARLLSGIGNAYSDEILHRARLSPFKVAARLDDREVRRLYEAAREVLTSWIERLRRETGGGFPEKVTAFRAGMVVHGRHGEPCPDCGTPIQRIRYSENEANYCARCQTGGKLLADRALSRLLRKDWPRTVEELEARRSGRDEPGGGSSRDQPGAAPNSSS